MGILKKKKIAASDFNPKLILGQPDEVRKVDLGTIGGIATGTTETVGPTGEVFVGLRGSFRFEDAAGNIVTAPVLWLPTGFDDDIKALFAGENPPSEVQFVYRISSVRASNPIGYSWAMEPLLNITAAENDDPVARLFSTVKGGEPALLTYDSEPGLPMPDAAPETAGKAKAK